MPKSKAPAQTFEEPKHLAHLVDRAVLVCIHLISGEQHRGVVEYWDADFVRLTAEHGPNLFIYKHDIRYIAEL
jgi:sRNA-binding regulator protein Hfq